MKGIFAILGGLGAGAAIMYLFDPDEGNRRRHMIRDKATSFTNQTQKTIDKKVRDISNRAKGLLHESKSAFSAHRQDKTHEQTSLGSGSFANRESYDH